MTSSIEDGRNHWGRMIRPMPVVCAVHWSVHLAGWLAPLLFFYVLIFRPLAFPDPPVDLAEDAMGWMARVPSPPSSPLKQVFYPLLFAISVFCFLATASYRRVPWISGSIVLLAGAVALAGISVAWTVSPEVTGMRAALFAMTTATLIFAVYASDRYQPIITRIFWVLCLSTVLNLAALVAFPAAAGGHMGIYTHKNLFGWVAALIFLFGLFKMLTGLWQERLAASVMLVAAPVLLYASQSKTSLGLALISPLLGLALWLPARFLGVSPVVVVPSTLVIAGLIYILGEQAAAWDFAMIAKAVFGEPTLTGRTPLWEFVTGLIAERPLLGYGYEAVFGTGEDGIPRRKTIGFPSVAATAHNGYLDMLLQLGVAGVIIVAAFVMKAFHAAGHLASTKPVFAWWALTLVIFIALHNCLESDIFISSNPLSMLLILLTLVSSRIHDEQRP